MKIRYSILMLVLCLLPVSALAAIEPSKGAAKYGSIITLSGDYEEYTITGSESGVSIIAQSGVKSITLDGASITAPDDQDALTVNGSLQMQLIGASTITGGSSYRNGGKGIVLPADAKLTFSGDGSLKVSGGDSLYEEDKNAVDGTGGTAIVGSVAVQDSARITVTGGNALSGYWEENVAGGDGVAGSVEINGGQLNATGGSASWADSWNTGGHGVNGSVVVNAGQLNASGGLGEWGRRGNKGGNGIDGQIEVNGGLLNTTGGSASENRSTYSINNSAGHGVGGDAAVNGGILNATGGQASGGRFSNRNTSKNNGGHGINGNAVINGGQLIATGNSASLSPNKNTGGNGVNGAFTAAGGYALVTGGNGDESRMGIAAASTEEYPVTIGSRGKFLSASVGVGTTPNAPLNNDEFYTAPTTETSNVSGKRSLETKESFAVTYSCSYDGCEASYTDYAEWNKLYTIKTPESMGFQDHGLTFAGFANSNGEVADSLIVSGPLTLQAAWKVIFTFDAGESDANSVSPIGVINSGSTVRLPECAMTAPAGYLFAGWMIDGDDKIHAVGDEVPAAKEIHLTAAWELIPMMPDTGDSGMPVLWLLLYLGSCITLLLLRKVRE